MEMHLVFLRQEVSLENLPDGAQAGSFARGLRGHPRAVSKDVLILRPKRLPSVDYGNVALLQLGIRSL